jgi:hypothetical protein
MFLVAISAATDNVYEDYTGCSFVEVLKAIRSHRMHATFSYLYKGPDVSELNVRYLCEDMKWWHTSKLQAVVRTDHILVHSSRELILSHTGGAQWSPRYIQQCHTVIARDCTQVLD